MIVNCLAEVILSVQISPIFLRGVVTRYNVETGKLLEHV